MIGERERYTTPRGERVTALVVDMRASMPVYDVEIVDVDGQVTNHWEIVGWVALSACAALKHWTRVV